MTTSDSWAWAWRSRSFTCYIKTGPASSLPSSIIDGFSFSIASENSRKCVAPQSSPKVQYQGLPCLPWVPGDVSHAVSIITMRVSLWSVSASRIPIAVHHPLIRSKYRHANFQDSYPAWLSFRSQPTDLEEHDEILELDGRTRTLGWFASRKNPCTRPRTAAGWKRADR